VWKEFFIFFFLRANFFPSPSSSLYPNGNDEFISMLTTRPLYPSGNNAFNLTGVEKNARRSIGFSYAKYRYRLYQIFASVSVVVIVFNDY